MERKKRLLSEAAFLLYSNDAKIFSENSLILSEMGEGVYSVPHKLYNKTVNRASIVHKFVQAAIYSDRYKKEEKV